MRMCLSQIHSPKPALFVAGLLALILLLAAFAPAISEKSSPSPRAQALRLAINDLIKTNGSKYPRGKEFLNKLDALDLRGADEAAVTALQREALLANPLLDFERILVIKRNANNPGLLQNWQGNSSMSNSGYDNELDILNVHNGASTKLYRPENNDFIGDICLHWNANKLLYSSKGSNGRWSVWEMNVDGSGKREITPVDQKDVENFNGIYLPCGDIIFSSTACKQGVPCVGGGDHVSLLYRCSADGSHMRQLTFDQDHNWYPAVMNDGQVLYTRWEYSDTPHYFTRILFQMNPDGTRQMPSYGSNSYWPNSIFYAKTVPGSAKIISIISGHHGVQRMGELLLFDPSKGQHEADGVVQRIPGRDKKVEPKITDQLVNDSWPRFLHPWPLNEKYFLVSCQPSASEPWGIYLVDTFDNMVKIADTPGYCLFEPIPLAKRPTPPIIPDKVDLKSKEATVYISNIYVGNALKNIPLGTVKAMRVYTDHFAFEGVGGHQNIAIDGPWDAKRILGTVPVYPDGSAHFKVPANTPIVLQPLDKQGRALAVMRSWLTAMPGERVSCVGCHENQRALSPNRYSQAARTQPAGIKPWYGSARNFGFETEVQPVLSKRCTSCHNGQSKLDLRALALRPDYKGRFTPAYEAIHPFVRRPGPESDYHLLPPAEYYANTSELVQMLKKGHHGVTLDAEELDRLVTWIDMNVPCHATWHQSEQRNVDIGDRRVELRKLYAGIDENWEREKLPDIPVVQPIRPPQTASPPLPAPTVTGWPFDSSAAKQKQQAVGETPLVLQPGDGVKLEMVRIPSGEFVMGDGTGDAPFTKAKISKPFWMARVEVTNKLYALFDPTHDSRYISMVNKDQDSRGYAVNEPEQPVVRVTWDEAMRFCKWLTAKTGKRFSLPTEAQWEWGCRAGCGSAFWFGDINTDFAKFANEGDLQLSRLQRANSPDWAPKEARFDDHSMVTTKVGGYTPNPWGLCDMHGNASEWTRSLYQPYPYNAGDGRESIKASGERVVRGGSWFDRPYRCTSAYRLSYPSWQGVYNVGFRVVCEDDIPIVKR